VETVLPQFAARGVTLERVAGDGGGAHVRGDADALAQLFANLLLNALEAVGPDGRVALSVAREGGDALTVSVADSGPGIPAAVLADLSEPEPAARTTKAGGTGLGLRIAARIAEAHGGRLSFDRTEGWGTVVRVALPALDDTAVG
jgi:signal transduction histidine kinase